MKEWTETRLKNLLAIPLSYGLNVSSEDDREDWPRYIRITDFDDFDHLNSETFKSLPLSIAEPALLRDGDLLFARSGATAGKTFLYSSLPNGACYAGYLIRARFKKNLVNPKFVSYFTKSTEYYNWRNRFCIQTTIQNISADKYNQLPIIIPSLSEQQRIVDYLDEKLSNLDNRIAVLEKQQDVYARLKKSVIHQAVTRGLNPNVALKDSGIEWIGMIPEHWEGRRLKDFSVLNPQYTGQEKRTEVSFLPMEGLRYDSTTLQSIPFEEGKGKYTFFADGDLLMAKVTPCFENGNIAIARKLKEGIGFGSSEIFVLRLDRSVSSRFFFYYVQAPSFQDEACSTMCGVGGLKRISPIFMRARLVFFPPLSEQQAIANYLDEKCAKISAAIENIGKQIDTSKHLKRALINEVITGQRAV